MFKVAGYILCFALLALAAQEVHRTACDSQVTLDKFFNSDTLHPASFYDDLVVDGYSWRGWYYSATTDWYPDVVIYFIARAVTGAAAPAMILSTCLLFALMLAAFVCLVRTIVPPEQRCVQTLLVLGVGAVFLLFNAKQGFRDTFFVMPLILTFHCGELICSIFNLALINYLIQSRDWSHRQRLAQAAMFFNTALCFSSDRLSIIHLIVPGIATLMLRRLLLAPRDERAPRSREWTVALVLLSAALCGHRLLRCVQPAWQDQFTRYPFHYKHAVAGLLAILQRYQEQLDKFQWLHVLAAVSLALCALVVLAAAIRRVRSMFAADRVAPANQPWLFIAIYYPTMSICTLASVCYAGTLYQPPYIVEVEWAMGARYFIPVLIMPLFGIGMWLAALPRAGKATVSMAACFAVFLVAAQQYREASAVDHDDQQGVWTYYPPEVRRLDAVAKKYGLRYGLASYWESRPFAVLSHTGLKVHPVLECGEAVNGFLPFHWLSNSRWYFDDPTHDRTPYEFIVITEHLGTKTISRSRAVETFGEPAAIVPMGGLVVFVYNRPEDERFHHLVERDAFFLRHNYNFQLGETIRFPGSSLMSPMFGYRHPEERLATQDTNSAGMLSRGPLMRMGKAGRYRLTIATSSSLDDVPNGHWKIFLSDQRNRSSFVVAEGPIKSGWDGVVQPEINVHEKHLGGTIDCRVFYDGWGWLKMDYLEIERITKDQSRGEKAEFAPKSAIDK